MPTPESPPPWTPLLCSTRRQGCNEPPEPLLGAQKGKALPGARGEGHPAQAQATEPLVDIKLSLLHRYRVKNRHNLNHKVYIFHRSNIQYT